MHPRIDLPGKATALISAQHGVITAAQLVDCGLTRRVIARMARDWERPSSGIFITRPPVWHTAVKAGLLRGGADAVVGAQAAAHLHRVVRDEPGTVMIWVKERRGDFTVGPWQVRFRRGARRGAGDPPRTDIHPTLLDLAVSADELEVVSAVTRAFADRRATPSRLLKLLDKRKKLRHSAVIRELCQASSGGIESALEWLFTRDVLRAHRLPEPQRQLQTDEGRVDLAYDCGLFVELDGMRDHADWSKDMFRDNSHALRLGVTTMRYGFGAAAGRACAAAAQLDAALAARGVRTGFRRCRRCRAAPVGDFAPSSVQSLPVEPPPGAHPCEGSESGATG